MSGYDDALDNYGDPGPIVAPYADTDPCPGAARVGTLPAWQHSHGVRCSCGMLLRFAWWSSETGHECGRCRRRREAAA